MRRVVGAVDRVWGLTRELNEFPVLGKPRYMRWATFSRHYQAWCRIKERRDAIWLTGVTRSCRWLQIPVSKTHRPKA
jgi:hypothetical protein